MPHAEGRPRGCPGGFFVSSIFRYLLLNVLLIGLSHGLRRGRRTVGRRRQKRHRSGRKQGIERGRQRQAVAAAARARVAAAAQHRRQRRRWHLRGSYPALRRRPAIRASRLRAACVPRGTRTSTATGRIAVTSTSARPAPTTATPLQPVRIRRAASPVPAMHRPGRATARLAAAPRVTPQSVISV